MTLRGPNNEDMRKIHSEINQIVNQRFLITTSAITLFGVIGAWMIPKDGSNIGGFTFAVSIILTIMLFVLFLFSHHLKRTLRIMTAYLLVTDASSWEVDWKIYRKKEYWAYTKAHTLVFLVLVILSTFFPYILLIFYPVKFTPPCLNILVGVISIIFIALMGFFKLEDDEKEIEKKWESLRDDRPL